MKTMLIVPLVCLIVSVSSICAASIPDFDDSGLVDGTDLIDFAAAWLSSTTGPENLDGVGTVDMADFAIFASWWLKSVPPSAQPEGYYVVRGGSLTVTAPGVLANDTGGATLSAVLEADVSNGSLTLNSNGSFTYTPTAGYIGLDTFTYKATKDGLDSNITTVTVTVGAPDNLLSNPDFELGDTTTDKADPFDCDFWTRGYNNVPDIWHADSPFEASNKLIRSRWAGSWVYQDFAVVAGEDYSLSIDVYNWTGSESVEWDGLLQVEWYDLSAVKIGSTVEVNRYVTLGGTRDQWVTVQGIETAPAGAVTGRMIFLNAHTDNPSGTGHLFYDNAWAYTGTVTAPVANDDSYSMYQGTSLEISAPGVLGNDADPQADPLTVWLESGVTEGTLTFNSDGSFTYTPAPGYIGPDSFTYKNTDGFENSQAATVSIMVNEYLGAPTANDDFYATSKNTVLHVPAAGVLANDELATAGDPMTAVLQVNANHGNVVLNADGSFDYTPDNNFTGTDSFTYKAYDNTAYSAAATVELTVLSANANVVTDSWPYSGPSPTTLVAASPLAGHYAVADRVSDTIEIRDIRHQVLNTITAADILAAMTWADISGSVYGPCSMTFTANGRLLFIGVCADPSSPSGGEPKDAVLRYNLNTEQIHVFDRLVIDAVMPAPVNYGMAHFKGTLYVGAESGLNRYTATRNSVDEDPAETVATPDSQPVTGLTVDMIDEKLYVSTTSNLYRADVNAALDLGSAIAGSGSIADIAFGRTYGGANNAGLYVLQNYGTQAALLHVPVADLRAGGTVDPSAYTVFGSGVTGISSAGCGRMLLADTTPKIMSDSTDTRLDFEAWVQDEFDQYVIAYKTLMWQDGVVPEGFQTRKIRAAGNGLDSSIDIDTSGWALFCLLAAYEVDNTDTEIETMVEKLLQRVSGFHPDGKAGIWTIDGNMHDRYDSDGNLTAANGTIYTQMKLLPAAYKAVETFPGNANIATYHEKLRSIMKRSSDNIRAEHRMTWGCDDYGPGLKNNGSTNETWIWCDLGAAQDPFAKQDYEEYLWSRYSIDQYDYFLADEPVLKASHSAFIILGAPMILQQHRDDSSWDELNRNYYAASMSVGEDLGWPYFSAFSAGGNPAPGISYHADGPSDHPSDVIHFPAVCGFGQYWTSPVVGAYYAYRDGRRQEMQAASSYSNPEMLMRWSLDYPDYVMPTLGIADWWFGGIGLAALLEPDLMDYLADYYYRPALEETTTPGGDVKLEYSKIGHRRVLGSDDNVNWTSYGFQLSPFVFDTGVSYNYYDAVDAEGEFIDMDNAFFEDGLNDWTSFGDYTITTSNSPHIVGDSLQIQVSPSDSSAESGVRQTLDVSVDLDNTRYIIRGDGLVQSAVPGRGFIRLQWDTDNNAGNGVISQQISSYLNTANQRVEFRIDANKPAGANYIHLSFVVEKLSSSAASYVFDNMSLVRLGAAAAFANGDFEAGYANWTTDVGSSWYSITSDPGYVLEGSSSLLWSMPPAAAGVTSTIVRDFDVSADPDSSRYIFRMDAKAVNMQDSDFEIEFEVYDNADALIIRRDDVGDILPSTDGQVVFTFRKRPGDDHYRIEFTMVRGTSNTTSTDEIVIDNILLDKETLF